MTDRLVESLSQCAACKAAFEPRSGRGRPARFCSPACRAAAYRRRLQAVPESLPRWPHARGCIALSELVDWEDDCATDRAARDKARCQRGRRAAQNRAWRRWRHTLAVADRLGVLYGRGVPSPADAAAWQAIADAVEECARLRVSGGSWGKEQATAERRVAELTPPHLRRADYRRQRREERDLGRPPSRGAFV
jgi:hypothetical protein